ncbi:rod shape-determining protein MreC [Cupriavidus metallidurans]|uniref:rod shape-determining protein MreC n=1 Tax=Cupriavidus TaxID=106589 RepID=UPI000E7F88AC|nr:MULTISPECIES: rod shape-determining protein MreC [unclassified Cupriavidus]GMG91906.1 rod shape-determining protein MreC [Cupriavidus sp. TKC]HBD36723.1 rod shape-determining protein MreC [Cupriavidus sp.]HBO79814.1 rod shape-determining protein MreC [Cupriavidus sp.]
MDYSPPPLFKQGTSAVARLVIFVTIALVLLIVDARFDAMRNVRQVAATVLMPVERLVLVPRDAIRGVFDYAQSSVELANENRELRRAALEQANASVRQAQLESENNQLRKLLNLTQQSTTPVTPAEILYDARDPYSQRIVIDRGSMQGLRAGYPVIDERGVIGQVTRVSPFQSEVTLLTDKEQAIPVQVVRNGLRSVAFGGSRAGLLDLRFMAASADLQQGDLLVTSGLDGTYPPGLPVAKIVQIERKADTAFSRVYCEPVAGVRSHRQLLVVRYESGLAPRPPEAATSQKAERGARSAAARAGAEQKADKAATPADKPADTPTAAPAQKPSEPAR